MSYVITRTNKPWSFSDQLRKTARQTSSRPVFFYYAEGPTGLIGVGNTATQAVADLRHEYRAFHNATCGCAKQGTRYNA